MFTAVSLLNACFTNYPFKGYLAILNEEVVGKENYPKHAFIYFLKKNK